MYGEAWQSGMCLRQLNFSNPKQIMKKNTWIIWLLLAAFCMPSQAQVTFRKEEVKSIMQRVADWQMDNFKPKREYGELDWTNGALYIGMMDWAELAERLDGTDRYYQWLVKLGKRNHWKMNKRMYHADDITVGQCFIELYRKYKDEAMIAPVIERADYVVSHPSDGTFKLNYGNARSLERWTWCDALFMAPPVYAKLYTLTGDKKYLKFMNTEFRATYDSLYDKGAKLFYRDWRYIGKQEANGKKVFWGRGNGWVIAGLADILKELPAKNKKDRKFYEELFRELSHSLATLQCEDGYWHASLLDPASYPSPETSATGFIVYGLAYGVNAGLLDRATYLPVIEKGWKALTDAVNEEGKLGYVQPIGADPQKVTKDMTSSYGVGAFLAAGCEIYKMAQ